MTIAAGETILASDIQAIKDDVDAILSASQTAVATSETTTSLTYTDLATSGPAVTLTTGTSVLVALSASMDNSGSNTSQMGVAVSGASTVAADNVTAISANGTEQVRAGALFLVSGLTAGSNTFTAKYVVGGGTGTFASRTIVVIPLGV